MISCDPGASVLPDAMRGSYGTMAASGDVALIESWIKAGALDN